MKAALFVIITLLAGNISVDASDRKHEGAVDPSLTAGRIAQAQMIDAPRSGTRNIGGCGSTLFNLEDGSQIATSNLHCIAQFERVHLLANGQSVRGRVVWPDQSLINKARAALDAKDLQFFRKNLDLAIIRLDSKLSDTAFKLSDLDRATSGDDLIGAFVFGGTQRRHVYKEPEALPHAQSRGSSYWLFSGKILWEGQSGALVFSVKDGSIIPEGTVSQIVSVQEGKKKIEGTLVVSSAAMSRFIQSYIRSQSTETAPTP